MKTSQQWWDEVKKDANKFNSWLVRQYRGEVTAAERIRSAARKFLKPEDPRCRIFNCIADQEETHARWVLDLLEIRGIKPSIENAEKRYWSVTLQDIDSIETVSGVGAHAERMRLERINVIVSDKSTPEDVRKVFHQIQKQEIWHAKMFAKMAGEAGLEKTKHNHLG